MHCVDDFHCLVLFSPGVPHVIAVCLLAVLSSPVDVSLPSDALRRRLHCLVPFSPVVSQVFAVCLTVLVLSDVDVSPAAPAMHCSRLHDMYCHLLINQ